MSFSFFKSQSGIERILRNVILFRLQNVNKKKHRVRINNVILAWLAKIEIIIRRSRLTCAESSYWDSTVATISWTSCQLITVFGCQDTSANVAFQNGRQSSRNSHQVFIHGVETRFINLVKSIFFNHQKGHQNRIREIYKKWRSLLRIIKFVSRSARN